MVTPPLHCVPGRKPAVIRDGAIKDLVAKIEAILPNVGLASEDLHALRELLKEELTFAATVRGKSLSAYEQGHI